ncbi:glutamate-5-semialdehyde dehydrogenase [Algoriphagus zhangzhouensis]|uniref:Gamma-glutamyl phosphate reductase n=1 Tax=Algoriphagus zhangzhouensis TaxID=1073327 RepID=A0A1M7ZJ75_9BACT|nr:glutamate-5-semialdehyde dehydrogenase [Algoriphagus zhangzhouensis]TDY43593.1 glutamate-5-semialdehyde dehydrogenase [Algoriphagus zhangzhouensis]SHO64960.1 glutamate-5-semialdehyde dehydrogenase [Algoriphagus zhangzhouensis]
MSDFSSVFQAVKKASRQLTGLRDEAVQKVLSDLADLMVLQSDFLLAENQKDLDRMDKENPMYDRLLLTEQRVKGIAQEMRQVSNLPSPLQIRLEEKMLPNGLFLEKVTVPLGVIGIIYEARPNVTFDVFSLALKSGNGLILKGGSDADASNQAIMTLIHHILEKHHLPKEAYLLLPPDRAATKALLEAVDFVDVIIPRGSQGLINFVRENAKVPVIETGAGIVHTYVDESADLEKAKAIIHNSKTRRPSVCNSLDCLIIHQSKLSDLNRLIQPLLESGVKIYADSKAIASLEPNELISEADDSHFGTEFLSLQMAIKTVDNLEEALDHIATYSSKHSEAIVSEDQEHIDQFILQVDAAAVYANSSTAFTDGAQFGLGAEIGISTQKLHARGPMALNELTSYKWVIRGNGQIRN